MVEFALVATTFALLMCGILNGAWYVYARNNVTDAAREGARAAIVSSRCDLSTATAAAQANAGAFARQLTVGAQFGSDSAGSFCIVTVTYKYAPIAGAFGVSAFDITSSSKEYQV